MNEYDTAYDWECAFEEANLALDKIASIEARSPGCNDEADWLAFGTLTSGEWFLIRSQCDYTGWDCQASGEHEVANSREDLVRLVMTEPERARLLAPEALKGFWER